MKIDITKECTGCGLCESINGDVFTVSDGMSHVNSGNIRGNEKDCIEAAAQCPVGAIKIQ